MTGTKEKCYWIKIENRFKLQKKNGCCDHSISLQSIEKGDAPLSDRRNTFD